MLDKSEKKTQGHDPSQSDSQSQTGNLPPSYGEWQPEIVLGKHPLENIDVAKAGTLHSPGTYPTPDLLLHPVGRYVVLNKPQNHDSSAIQAALDALGEQATLYLPQGTRWTLGSTIVLKRHQELATWGYPTNEESMALLEAESTCKGYLLKGTGMEGVRIRNLVIDGRADKFGYSSGWRAMVQLGGKDGQNQVLDRCTLVNPREWTCIHHTKAEIMVTNNQLRLAETESREMEIEFQWTGGISFASRNGLIAGNQIIDARKGGIDIFGASGTLVTSNTIITRNCIGSGGIIMVEHNPNDGNYENTRVVHNTIRIEGSYLKTAVAQGHHVLWAPVPNRPTWILRGGTVTHNLIESKPANPESPGAVGYGFIVSHVENWVCTDNVSAPGVTYEGDLSDIDRSYFIVSPGPFVRSVELGPDSDDQKRLDSVPGTDMHSCRFRFQKDFVAGDFTGLIRVKPGKLNVAVFAPGELNLRIGEAIKVGNAELVFEEDGELRLMGNGEVMWSSGSQRHVKRAPDARVVLEQGGKWLIVSGSWTLYDLTPNLPPFGLREIEKTVGSWGRPQLAVSDTMPYISLTSPNRSIILATSYQGGQGWRLHKDSWISQASSDGRHTLVSLASPFGQYMVLQTVEGREMPAIEWPLDSKKWKVVWCSPNTKANRAMVPDVVFQSDGNFVIYNAEGKPLWATGTPATYIEWGNGSENSPYFSVVDARGKAIWSSNV